MFTRDPETTISVFHIIKKPGSKFYKPNCEVAKKVVKNILHRKLFSEDAIETLQLAGYRIVKDDYDNKPSIKTSTFDTPCLRVKYNFENKDWEAYFKDTTTGQMLGDLIIGKTKKHTLESLMRTMKSFNINNLQNN